MTADPAQTDRALAQFRGELNERLVVHWTGGAWRVPMATRHLAVAAGDGSALGRIVCADAADIARARAALTPGPPVAPEALVAAMGGLAPLLDRLRALEGQPGDAWNPADATRALERATGGPTVILSAAAWPVSDLAGRLAAGATRGVIWKPAPGASASAHLVVRALAPLLGGAVALLQGDHASGRLLAAGATVDWCAAGAPPGA